MAHIPKKRCNFIPGISLFARTPYFFFVIIKVESGENNYVKRSPSCHIVLNFFHHTFLQ